MEASSPPPPPKPPARRFWDWATGEKPRWVIPPVLVLLLTVALALRLYGVTWDHVTWERGGFFHPDERSIYMRVDCMYRLLTKGPAWEDCTRDSPFRQVQPGFPSPTVFLDAAKSPLNPHWFPLGSMILYVLLAIKLLLAPLVTMDMEDLALVGRTLSSLADVGTVALVYLLGRRLYGRGAGILAAVLVTFAVTHIQHSHFYRPEPFANLFTLAAFWFMLDALERGRLRDSAMLGLSLGLALATKVSVLPLLLPVAVVFGYLFRRVAAPAGSEERARQRGQWLLSLLTVGAVAQITYLFWTPYALLDFPEFLGWNLRELEIVRKAGIVPYTVQYLGAPKFAYELRQLSVWGLGLPLAVLAWGGLAATVVLNVWRPRLEQVLLLLWAIPLLLIVGSVEVKFARYIFPLTPILVLMGSGVAWKGLEWLGGRGSWLRWMAAGTVGLVVLATVFYALAFVRIYSRPHTAVQASQWINANVPQGARILMDNHWDEWIPDLGRNRVDQLPMFDGDSPAKMDSLARELADADYLAFYSNRTYGAIARVPDRFPLSGGYYRLLFSGELGYELTASFSAYPRLLGVAFVDDPMGRAGVPVPELLRRRSVASLELNLGYADNDVITYDHPMVLVFRNTGHYDRNRLLTLLLSSGTEERAGPSLSLMLTPEEAALQQRGGTWSDLFREDSLANRFPVVAWLLLVEAASLAALPLGFLVFHGLHDKGYLLTKTLAVLLLAYFPWWMAALKVLPFGRLSIYAGMVALALGSGIAVAFRRRLVVDFLRNRWRFLVLEECLFLLAFFAFLAIRWANPDLWHPWRGGEKPMDFAYLNAIVRSTTVPPYDPWFAGGYLNYYYFGQFIVATLIKATGVLPEVAYNLAVPLLFALTAGGAFSVAYNLASALRQREGGWFGPSWGPAAAGVSAALLVVVLGNLGGAVQLARIVGSGMALVLPPEGDDFHVWFWFSSRMMPGQISITEFPLWTFLFADLHAHLIAIPFALLVMGLSLNLVLTATASGRPWRWAALPLPALALAVGSLAAINTWDYPAYLLLAGGSVCLALYARGQGGWRLLAAAALGLGAMAVLSYLAFLPFHARNEAFGGGVHASNEQTKVLHYVAIHGLFLFILLSYLSYEGLRHLRPFLRRWAAPEALAAGPPAVALAERRGGILLPWWLAFSAVVAAYLVAAGYPTVALLFLVTLVVVLLGVRWLAGRRPDGAHHLFLLMLMGAAFAIGLGVDLVTVDNDIDRMNTVFKLYLQTWVLFGVGSAVALWYLFTAPGVAWHRLFRHPATWSGVLVALLVAPALVHAVFALKQGGGLAMAFTLLREGWVLYALAAPVLVWHLVIVVRRWWRPLPWAVGVWLGVLLVLVAGAGVFVVPGARVRLAERFSTAFTGLNGAGYMERAVYQDEHGPILLRWDWQAIQWLRENVEGSPVVAEGNTAPHQYRWGSRVSVYTGLPTIVGWGWHQTQQRFSEEAAVRRRLDDVKTLYSTTDVSEALRILRQYDVRYVYVGELERLYYPRDGLAKFQTMADQGVMPVYPEPEAIFNPQVVIYQVNLAQEGA